MVSPRHAEVHVLMVSALASGQGKTTATAAVARALVKRGLRVRVFKCGSDFIDPMLLERASGAPVGSLDLWMVGIDQCRSQLAQAARAADVILVEGVMGLYDGTPSSADLARALGIPVMAVIDASAMAQTAGAVVQGLRDYGPVEMAGVIANRVAGPGHAGMIAASLRDVPLFATLPRQDKTLPERHLGLVLPSELPDLARFRRNRMERAAHHADRPGRPSGAAAAPACRQHDRDRARPRLRLPVSGQPGHLARHGRHPGVLLAAGEPAGSAGG
jgi:cobyrinic acid a,c-diamide synthase